MRVILAARSGGSRRETKRILWRRKEVLKSGSGPRGDDGGLGEAQRKGERELTSVARRGESRASSEETSYQTFRVSVFLAHDL